MTTEPQALVVVIPANGLPNEIRRGHEKDGRQGRRLVQDEGGEVTPLGVPDEVIANDRVKDGSLRTPPRTISLWSVATSRLAGRFDSSSFIKVGATLSGIYAIVKLRFQRFWCAADPLFSLGSSQACKGNRMSLGWALSRKDVLDGANHRLPFACFGCFGLHEEGGRD